MEEVEVVSEIAQSELAQSELAVPAKAAAAHADATTGTPDLTTAVAIAEGEGSDREGSPAPPPDPLEQLFDVIIMGTGMVESIVSGCVHLTGLLSWACTPRGDCSERVIPRCSCMDVVIVTYCSALSRIGKKVLHLDQVWQASHRFQEIV